MTQANVSTVFVADRIKEIPFSNRTYIHHLLKLEDRALGMPVPKPRGMYGGYDPVLLHPVRWECIRKEVQEGVYTAPPDFHRKFDEWKRAVEARERARNERQEARFKEFEDSERKVRAEIAATDPRPSDSAAPETGEKRRTIIG